MSGTSKLSIKMWLLRGDLTFSEFVVFDRSEQAVKGGSRDVPQRRRAENLFPTKYNTVRKNISKKSFLVFCDDYINPCNLKSLGRKAKEKSLKEGRIGAVDISVWYFKKYIFIKLTLNPRPRTSVDITQSTYSTTELSGQLMLGLDDLLEKVKQWKFEKRSLLLSENARLCLGDLWNIARTRYLGETCSEPIHKKEAIMYEIVGRFLRGCRNDQLDFLKLTNLFRVQPEDIRYMFVRWATPLAHSPRFD